MVNTLFASKVIFVNQPIIMLLLHCHRLAGGGIEWLRKFYFCKIKLTQKLQFEISYIRDIFITICLQKTIANVKVVRYFALSIQ